MSGVVQVAVCSPTPAPVRGQRVFEDVFLITKLGEELGFEFVLRSTGNEVLVLIQQAPLGVCVFP